MEPVRSERHQTTAVICIDSPPVNALSHDVRKGLYEHISAADANEEIRSVVLLCAGQTFVAGADIREFDRPAEAPLLPDLVNHLEACRKPVIAALHGTALGGGLEIAMGCHYRIATRDARVGLPEVKLGLLPGATGTQRLPRLVGVELALDMMLSGEPISAQAALEAGLIDRIVSGDLEKEALAFALQAETSGPRRVRDLEVAPVKAGLFDVAKRRVLAKSRGLLSPERIVRCVELATEASFDVGCDAERRYFLECKDSPQAKGLRHAFFAERAAAKKTPRGTGIRSIRSIGIVGAGTMGAGIAYSCLAAGYSVHLLDKDLQSVERGRRSVEKLFAGGIERGKTSPEEAETALRGFTAGSDPGEIGRSDLVIEAVFEDMEIKKAVFAQLDEVCKSDAILATNTSTLDIDQIASVTGSTREVIGLHFFSPAHIMRLVEIVRGKETPDEAVATSVRFAKSLNKVPVVVRNGFGFVGNRMLYGYGRENQLMLLEGAAPEYIDRVLSDWGMAMGPNAVGDLAGLDVGYRVRRERKDLPDDPRFYRVADLLVERGRLGRKTGEGIYRYEAGSNVPLPDPEVQALIREEARRLGVEQREIREQEIIERCIYALVTEGARILEERIAQQSSDIDVIWINGYGFPRYRGGPMHYADSTGLDRVLRAVELFEERFGSLYWKPPTIMRELAATGGHFADVR